MNTLLFFAIALCVFCIVTLIGAPWFFKPSEEARRILDIVKSERPDKRTVRAKEIAREKLLDLARAFRSRLGLQQDEKLRQRFVSAGMKGSNKLDVYFAARFIGPLIGIIAGTFVRTNTMFWCLCLAAVGYLLPDMWLTRMVRARQRRIQRGIPDAIDLLTICVEAGLGLDQALLRIGQEIAVSYPDLNEEFNQISLEQRAGKPRLEAWQGLADRTKLPEFIALVSMLVQTDRFGTPIVRALSRYAEELRLARKQKAEEAAVKTKIQILFPLVLFIFPCIFIVLLGPAIISLSTLFK
ncbi:MAG TPA: type II secretion system F family protein [Acidobacteriaceae bacterium]|nr:type II secretion system F family protein [Acidobacteriaceae bacterium]